MIDTHAHIYEPEFDEDRSLVIERARAAGVQAILLPNINAKTVAPLLDLCREHPHYCFPMMGLHPEDVKDDFSSVLDYMQDCLKSPNNPYVAIGEIGLDFYWDDTFRKQQIEAFERQVCWATEFHLPLVIHCRSAHQQLLDVMRAHKTEGLTGIFHCFGGSLEEACELLDFEGFVLGVGGVLTYKKSTLPEVVRNIPLERLVLETDCPYLAPVPHRGKRNESAFVVSTMECLAHEKCVSLEEVQRITNKTVIRLFPKAFPADFV